MKPLLKYAWIGLHIVLTALLWNAMFLDFSAKGQIDDTSGRQAGFLIVISLAIVLFGLAMLKLLAEKLFPSLRRRQGQQAVRHQ